MDLLALAWPDPGQLGLFIPIVAIVGAFVVAIVGTVSSSHQKIRERREIEQSRREIAAYVAEGSMSPDDARRILESDPSGAPKRT